MVYIYFFKQSLKMFYCKIYVYNLFILFLYASEQNHTPCLKYFWLCFVFLSNGMLFYAPPPYITYIPMIWQSFLVWFRYGTCISLPGWFVYHSSVCSALFCGNNNINQRLIVIVCGSTFTPPWLPATAWHHIATQVPIGVGLAFWAQRQSCLLTWEWYS